MGHMPPGSNFTNSVQLAGPSGATLRYVKGEKIVRIADERATISKLAQSDVFWLLVSEFGNIVSHDQIVETIDRVANVASYDDPKNRAARFIAILRDDLALGTKNLEGFIKNVRGAGYTVSDRWKKAPSPALVERTSIAFLDALGKIVSDCIDHASQRRVISCPNGLQFIDFDKQFSVQRYEILDTMLWNVIKTLSLDLKANEVIALKPHFQELASYILYWRIGDNLSEDKWKSDYREEIETKASMLRDLVESLVRKIRSK